MKITVFGATGGTGRQLVEQGLRAGHQVTAVVRDPARLRVPRAAGLDVVTADVTDPDAIEPAVAGRDAVLSALGSREIRRPTTVCADGVRGIITATTGAGVRRLLVVSAAPLAEAGEGPLTRFVAKPLLLRVFRHTYDDLREMERLLRATSTLDWTVLRPPKLTNGPRTGRYRTATEAAVRGRNTISRADLADAMLSVIDDPTTIRHAIGVAA